MLKRDLRRWGAGGFKKKISAPLFLMTTYQMSLISPGSISLDSTFKYSIFRQKIFSLIFFSHDYLEGWSWDSLSSCL
jgi:hypothetical protein